MALFRLRLQAGEDPEESPVPGVPGVPKMRSAGPALLPLLLLTCATSFGSFVEKNFHGLLRSQCGTEAAPVTRTNTTARLRELRNKMRNPIAVLGPTLDAYIVPSYDEHQSEVPSVRDKRLMYVSGFSGSDGIAVVTLTSAALWTDGRYRNQADIELGCQWLLMMQDETSPTLPQWLGLQLKQGARVGADPKLIPHFLWDQWEQELHVMGIQLVRVTNNLIDLIWNTDNRPSASKVQIYVQNEEFSGKPWVTKVQELRKWMDENLIDATVVTALDEIAWLLNIRGKDLAYTPVAKCYLIVSVDHVRLYIDQNKVSIDANRNLKTSSCFEPNCTKIFPYENIWSDLRTFSQAWRTVLLPASYSFSPGVSEAIFTSVTVAEKRIYKTSPIINMKAVKNPTEIAGMRKAHIRDGAAMCDVLAYIQKRMEEGDDWTEYRIVDEVDRTRKSQEFNKGLSFATIAGYGPNSALPHYQPMEANSRIIYRNSTLVLDSGGQYSDGTTDVTRTLHYGQPTRDHVKAYTLVLMASIDLSLMVFPADLNMNDVDVVARKALWQNKKDYMHSTGHGVGSFLQAHEAPILIAYNQVQDGVNFKPGYFFSNEPGYYEEGNFGVRLENVLEVIEAFGGKPDVDGKTYLAFKDVTLVPYEPKLIDVNMLTLYQRRWLNDYYKRIRENVGAELKRQMKMEAFYWMMNKTVHIPEHGLVNSITKAQPSLCLLVIAIFAFVINIF